MSDKRILVTGGSGVLGTAIKPFMTRGVTALFPTRAELNVASHIDWNNLVESFDPTEVWHFAAETPSNSERRWYLDVNIMGSALAALFCQMGNMRLVYTSTDYLFGYTPDDLAPYAEDAPFYPWNDYAWSKLGGEAAVRLVDDHLIIRGSWYGDDTFDSWEVGATDSQTSKYYVNLAARDIAQLALSGVTGTFHVGMTYPRSLREVAHVAGYELGHGNADDLNVPHTTALDTSKCQRVLRSLPE